MSSTAKKLETPSTSGETSLFKENIINAFCTGLKETLTMMAKVECSFEKPSIEFMWKTEGDISGVVDFDTTEFKGSIYIHFPASVLIQIYNHMVGESYTEANSEVLDCIGEISNMAYGVAKGKLDPLQLKFSMSLPKPYKTPDLRRLPAVPHLLIPFRVFDKRCLLEITLSKK
jgi:CheY-specific phosphatase CheX